MWRMKYGHKICPQSAATVQRVSGQQDRHFMIKSMKQRRQFLSDKEKSMQSRCINKNSFSNEGKMNKQCGAGRGGGAQLVSVEKVALPPFFLK